MLSFSNELTKSGAEAMCEGPRCPGAVARSLALEKDLKDLERLLKADQAAVAAANGGAAGGESARIKQSLRTVLRKLMEAYFNPLNGTHRSQDGHITSSRIVTSHPQD